MKEVLGIEALIKPNNTQPRAKSSDLSVTSESSDSSLLVQQIALQNQNTVKQSTLANAKNMKVNKEILECIILVPSFLNEEERLLLDKMTAAMKLQNFRCISSKEEWQTIDSKKWIIFGTYWQKAFALSANENSIQTKNNKFILLAPDLSKLIEQANLKAPLWAKMQEFLKL